MIVKSLNIGLPKEYEWDGKKVLSGIQKRPVDGPVLAEGTSLVGDGIANKKHHGGKDKSIYGYPAEHYELWEMEYPHINFEAGDFGENLTTFGLLEDDLHIGDELKVGTSILKVTQPRLPCNTFGNYLGDKTVIKHFAETRRSGFYFTIKQAGEISMNDEIEIIYRDPNELSVAKINDFYYSKNKDQEFLKFVLSVEALAESWKNDFKKYLD